MTSYITIKYTKGDKVFKYGFDWELYKQDIAEAVRATDNVIDSTIYPLESQEIEAKNKRRMGLGITGLANALEVQGMSYGSPEFLKETQKIMRVLRDTAYETSCELAKEKGAFPLFDADEYLKGGFAKKLPPRIRKMIKETGIRNSHLISIAPTGTISFCADNISSGIEPPFSLSYQRTVQGVDGPYEVTVEDFAYRMWGVEGKCADELSPQEHMAVQVVCQPYVDSAISKTCNVGADVTWAEFKDLYLEAWKQGLKGITTFRASGLRYGILNKVEEEDTQDAEEMDGKACFFNERGEKECG